MSLEAADMAGMSLNFAECDCTAFNVWRWRRLPHLLCHRVAQGRCRYAGFQPDPSNLFSSLTTGVAFGSLYLSSHPGTASMGELLIISLTFIISRLHHCAGLFAVLPVKMETKAQTDPKSSIRDFMLYICLKSFINRSIRNPVS